MRLASTLSAVVGAGACLTLASPAMAQTHVFTANADFDSGALNNVVHVPANQLQLGPTPVSKTTLVWVDNYVPGWIVRIDSSTGKQTARFDSALQTINGQATGARPSKENCNWANTGNCPGRVAVDTNGDVWIVNRSFGTQGTLSKFSGNIGHCIDRNNNGVIDTSRDANNDGIVNPNDPTEYLAQNDECILTTIPVGGVNHVPRAVAVDKKGKIWVSTYNGQTLYRFNPNEPVALEKSLPLPGRYPYSMASGGDYVFISNMGSGGTIRVHIDTLAVDYAPCPTTYGVVGDPSGNYAFLGNWGNAGISKADFINHTCPQFSCPGITAVTMDLAGNIWGSGYAVNQVYKFTPNGVLLGQYATGGANPHGLSVDFQGNIWSVHDGVPNLVKFSAAGANLGAFNIGSPAPGFDYTPYLYSDYTGVQIDRQAPYARVGIWEGTYDGGANAIPWSNVTWNTEPQGAVPTETTLIVSSRAADTLTELATAPYAPCQNGAPMVGIKGRYVQVKVDFQGPGYKTPVLADLVVHGPCGNLGETCCVQDPDCNDSKPCTQDVCPVPGGVCSHALIPECCQLDPDCNDSNACTVDTCISGTCQHAMQAGCCMANQDCDDSLPCTADLCSGLGGTCSNVAINGCCMDDLDCTKGNPCSDSKCPAPGGLCDIKYKAGCCQTDSDCTDTDLCTTDLCNTANNTCSNTQIVGCCNVDNQCFDNNECTTDTCSGPGGICQFIPKAKCCTPTDPEVGQPCDFPVSPNDHPPCAPGHLACENNDLVCKDAKKPDPKEKCDWLDNNCDGNIDENSCPTGTTCINGICAKPCGTPEFPCDAGFVCKSGVCLPIDCTNVICAPGNTCVYGDCVSGDGGVGGSAGNAGVGGAAGADGGAKDGAAGNPDSGKGGAGAAAGSGQGGLAGKAGTAGNAGTTGASGSGHKEPENFGMTTGGGGCKCSAPGESSPSKMALIAAAGLAIAVTARRKRARK